MQSRIFVPAVALAVVFALQSTASNAQTRIGSATSVQPEASGSVGGTMSVGSGVHANETVKTGSSGKAGLQFHDQSNLNVGPSSQVRLESLCMIQTKGPAARLLKLPAAHSGFPPVLKTRVR